jgi:hypothetical protein
MDHSKLFTSKTIVNGINADLLKAMQECNEDHNKRHKVDQDDKQGISMDAFMELLKQPIKPLD